VYALREPSKLFVNGGASLIKTFLCSVFLILALSCATRLAADEALQIGEAEDGVVSTRKPASYLIVLKRGDFAETDVTTHGTKLIITVYDASGNKVRGFKPDAPEQKIGFIADTAGIYRLEVGPDGIVDKGPYSIKLTRIVTLQDRVDQAPVAMDRPESSQIDALRAALGAHQPNALANFCRWLRPTARL
jgi:hypothetical protein